MAVLTYHSTQTNGGSGSSNLVVTKPTSLSVGDLMLASLVTSNTLVSYSPFTLLYTKENGSSLRCYIFSKVADASDVSASNFTFGMNNTGAAYGSISRISGFNPTTPISLYSDYAASTSTLTIPTLTPITKNSLIFLLGASNANSGTYSGYAIQNDNPTWTELYESGNIDGTLSTALAVSSLRSATSATGNATIDVTQSSTAVGQMIIVNPSITSSVITETITTSDTIHKMVSSIFTATISTTDSISQTLGRLWNKVSKPVTTWVNRNKN